MTEALTHRRTWVGAALAAVLGGTVWVVADGPTGQSFTTLQTPFTQALYATSASVPQDGSILGGVAFAPDGRVWSSECSFLGTRLHRFATPTTSLNGSSVHAEDLVVDLTSTGPGGIDAGGCGLVNHPNGSMYSNSIAGLWQLDASTGALVAGPFGHPGNALGIAVDPQSSHHLVYVGDDCHPSLDAGGTTCTIWDFDPATHTSSVFARLSRTSDTFIDGMYFDPSGDYLFAAHRQEDLDANGFITQQNSLQIIHRPAALRPANASVDDGQTVRFIPMQSEPDGVAFHAGDGFVVTLNESLDCLDGSNAIVSSDPNLAACPAGTTEAGGSMTRFDFANGYNNPPTGVSTFASGGFRGDLVQVGPDGCIYGTQAPLFVVGGLYGVRYDNGVQTGDQSLVQICGGFVIPPGVAQPGSLAGTVYHDKNRNSALDGGDLGLGGVTVTLVNTGTGATTTTVTAADGSYLFGELQAATYQISSPATASGLAIETSSPLTAALQAGENLTDRNFGYISGKISGFAFVDWNRNHVKDPGETVLGGVTISTAGVGATVTAPDGSYHFTDLVAGSYAVSSTATASGKAIDTASTINVPLAAGQDQPDVNFGYVPGGLSGFAYVDANRNSVKDPSEAGIPGVVISIGGALPAQTTGADGSYTFADLDADTYSVSAPATASGKALFTSSPLTVALAAGENHPDVNFGYVPGGLSGFAYVDSNRNGVMDGSEAGIGGVVITLAGMGTQTTAANGSYSFANLDAATYSVSAPATASAKALSTTNPLGVPLGAGATQANVNFGYVPGGLSGFAFVDSNRNGVKDGSEPGIGGVVISLAGGGTQVTTGDGSYSFANLDAATYSVAAPAIAAGKSLFTGSPLSVALAAGESHQNVNFGYVPGGLSGFAYHDLNRNGMKDGGEPGIAGVVITLAGGGTRTTAADGSYSFGNLDAGTYNVTAPSAASGEALFTTSPLGVSMSAGQFIANVNFGYVPGAISGYAYADSNRNGVKDSGEPGLGGVVITLNSGATQTTAANGFYSFSSLASGSYGVTSPGTAQGLALDTVGALATTLNAGQVIADLNFGYVNGSLSGFAYNDANGNGTKDSGEAGISGVTITLSGPVGATTTTAGDGSYSFTGLIAGTYSVSAPSTAAGMPRTTTSPLSVPLAAGGYQPNVNFGYRQQVIYVTYTQGGWGATPQGNNPAMLLKNKFATVYPGGSVTIGGSPYYLKFTSQSAIGLFLPAGGTPGVLNKSATNPTSSSANVFAGQVLALQLGVDFSTKGVTQTGLADLKVATGNTLAGYTVTQVLALANQVLAGNTAALPAGVTVSKLNDLLSAMNQNFDGGTTNNGVLIQ